MFFFMRVRLKNKERKCKTRVTKVACANLFVKYIFVSNIFFAIRWPVLWSLQKFILVLNFIFIIFNPLWVREERKWLESGLKRERYHFNDFSYQHIKLLFQMVPYDKGSLIWVFLSKSKIGKKLVSWLILGFEFIYLFCVFGA